MSRCLDDQDYRHWITVIKEFFRWKIQYILERHVRLFKNLFIFI